MVKLVTGAGPLGPVVNLNEIDFGILEFVARAEAGATAQNLAITNISVDLDDFNLLIMLHVNKLAVSGNYGILLNSDAQSAYDSQIIQAEQTTLSTAKADSATVAPTTSGAIKMNTIGWMTNQTDGKAAFGGTTTFGETLGGLVNFAVARAIALGTAITTVTLGGSAASILGSGTTMELYKRSRTV